ncbi:MAG: PQQ-dependent sugar dehydrogenase [Inquilinaceae bacterium]
MLLRDADGDGRAETVGTFIDDFDRPYGLAILDGHLYVADADGLWRIPYAAGDETASDRPERLTARSALGSARGHWTRSLAISPDGTRAYIGVGSRDNIDDEDPPRATIQEFALDGGEGAAQQSTLASGLRNPVGMAFAPGTSDLYTVVNERDGLGDGLVPDFLTRVERGAFYGWPYAYIGPNPQPDYAERRPDLVEQTVVPDVLFEAHSAPIGLVFYDGDLFPPDYRGDAFVALRGSWNRSDPTGYKVVRVPFTDGRPEGWYETFASGFWTDGTDQARVWGRPTGLAVMPDGALLIADEIGGTIWRVTYGQ